MLADVPRSGLGPYRQQCLGVGIAKNRDSLPRAPGGPGATSTPWSADYPIYLNRMVLVRILLAPRGMVVIRLVENAARLVGDWLWAYPQRPVGARCVPLVRGPLRSPVVVRLRCATDVARRAIGPNRWTAVGFDPVVATPSPKRQAAADSSGSPWAEWGLGRRGRIVR